MQLIVVLKTIEPLTPLLPDFVTHKVIRCRRMGQFGPMLKEWKDAHPECKEDIEQAYNEWPENKQSMYRHFELEVRDDVDVEMLVNFLDALDVVLSVETN